MFPRSRLISRGATTALLSSSTTLLLCQTKQTPITIGWLGVLAALAWFVMSGRTPTRPGKEGTDKDLKEKLKTIDRRMAAIEEATHTEMAILAELHSGAVLESFNGITPPEGVRRIGPN